MWRKTQTQRKARWLLANCDMDKMEPMQDVDSADDGELIKNNTREVQQELLDAVSMFNQLRVEPKKQSFLVCNVDAPDLNSNHYLKWRKIKKYVEEDENEIDGTFA